MTNTLENKKTGNRGTCGPPARSRPEARRRKARKILTVLEDCLGSELRSLRCLDLGCGGGVISISLAETFATVVGVDVHEPGLSKATEDSRHVKATFVAADGLALPFAPETFDVVVCAQVYEHVPDPAKLMSEIHRVLKKNAVCFFSGPNRLAPIEEHYSVPFVHWLPKPLADLSLRALGKGNAYNEKPLSYWGLRRLVSNFEVVDYTAKIIRSPAVYACEEEVRLGALFSRIPEGVMRGLTFAFPNYNWVLRKKR